MGLPQVRREVQAGRPAEAAPVPSRPVHRRAAPGQPDARHRRLALHVEQEQPGLGEAREEIEEVEGADADAREELEGAGGETREEMEGSSAEAVEEVEGASAEAREDWIHSGADRSDD